MSRDAVEALRSRCRDWTSYLHLLPFGSVYLVFVLTPIVLTFVLSTARWDGINAPAFVGLANYAELPNDDYVLKAFTNLLLYVSLTIPLGIGTGLALALFLDRLSGPWGAFVRSASFFPFIMPLFLTAVIWQWMYTPDYGLVNQTLNSLGLPSVDWLTNTNWMIPALVIVDTWHSAGFNMLLIWAGLRVVPTETREAATVDGASTLQEIRLVILPQIRLVVFVVAINGLVSAFQVFDLPWLLTKSGYLEGAGGPEQTLLFPVMAAVTRGLGSLRFGDSAVIGVMLLAIIGLTTVGLFGVRRRWGAEL